MIWLLASLGAFLWRLRGGLLNDITGVANWEGFNDTVVRAIWSIGMAVGFWVFSGWSWHIPVLMVALFLGTTVIGWFGANISTITEEDYLLITFSTTLRLAFVSAALLSPWPILAGLLGGLAYKVGSLLPVPVKGWVWQEIIFGAMVGASLAAVVIWPVSLGAAL